MEEVEIRDLKRFAVERDQRAPAGHGQIVGANRVGPVAAKGRLAGGDWKGGAWNGPKTATGHWTMASRNVRSIADPPRPRSCAAVDAATCDHDSLARGSMLWVDILGIFDV